MEKLYKTDTIKKGENKMNKTDAEMMEVCMAAITAAELDLAKDMEKISEKEKTE